MGDSTRLWHTSFIDNNFRSWSQCWDESLQNQGTVLIRPVMEDPTEKVDIRLDGLKCEHVVNHELESVFELSWNIAIGLFDHLFHVLDNDREIGEVLGQFHGNMPGTSSNINHFDWAQRLPVIVGDNVRRVILLHRHIRFHTVCKSLGPLGICS